MIVDFNGNLALANTSARSMFGINLLDLGHPLQDLEISYRPLELRSHIDQIYSERRLLQRRIRNNERRIAIYE
jgi:two-component system CheB/CheR fusion protein